MTKAATVLAGCRSVLVVDWPSQDVPAVLAAAGLTVFVKGGPGHADYTEWAIIDGQLMSRYLGRQPDHADLVYFYRPFTELPTVIALAMAVGARAVWRQSGISVTGAPDPMGCYLPPDESRDGSALAAAAGLDYVDDVYIGDVVRQTGLRR